MPRPIVLIALGEFQQVNLDYHFLMLLKHFRFTITLKMQYQSIHFREIFPNLVALTKTRSAIDTLPSLLTSHTAIDIS